MEDTSGREDSEDVLSYSKMIADVESEEKDEDLSQKHSGNKRRKSDCINGYVLREQSQRVVKLTSPTQINYAYKLPLDEKLKKSEPL